MQTTVMREMIWKKVSLEAVPKNIGIGAEVTTGGRLFQKQPHLSSGPQLYIQSEMVV